MIALVYIFIGILFIVLQTTIFMFNPVWLAAPDLYFILTVYLAYRFDLVRGLLIIFPVSWLFDVFSGTIIGMYPAICFSGFFMVRIMSVKMPIKESFYQLPMIGGIYLLVCRIIHFFMTFVQPDTLMAWSWSKALFRACLIVAFAFPIFHFLEYVNTRLDVLFFKSFRTLRMKPGNRFR